ncbi:hypothetical protein ACQEV9_44205 [Streptomyces chartreusis]|uniref:hypothetical protein n=1 Tax=Streptomyces chartreusis TaxID=1969 RepID=UPI003D92A1D2
MATLVYQRHGLPHAVLGLLFGVERSIIAPCDHRNTHLLVKRGYAVPARPGLRLQKLPDVFAYGQAEGIDATGRNREPSPSTGRPRRTARVRFREREAEHDEGHRHRRTASPHVMGRCSATWQYARCLSCPQRGHRHPLPASPTSNSSWTTATSA